MMIHYTRPGGAMPLVVGEPRHRSAAASDVGHPHRFALASAIQNPVVYGDEEPVLSDLSKDDRSTIEQMFVRAPMSPKAYIELTDAIAAAIAGPKVDVQLGRPACSGAQTAAGGGGGELRADRAAHPHASAGDHLSARLGGSGIFPKVSSAISMTSASCRSG
jgi:hypothetical protein